MHYCNTFFMYPRVAAWLADMRALPSFDPAHEILQVCPYAPPLPLPLPSPPPCRWIFR